MSSNGWEFEYDSVARILSTKKSAWQPARNWQQAMKRRRQTETVMRPFPLLDLGRRPEFRCTNGATSNRCAALTRAPDEILTYGFASWDDTDLPSLQTFQS